MSQYVYIVEFSDTAIEEGKTRNPEQRRQATEMYRAMQRGYHREFFFAPDSRTGARLWFTMFSDVTFIFRYAGTRHIYIEHIVPIHWRDFLGVPYEPLEEVRANIKVYSNCEFGIPSGTLHNKFMTSQNDRSCQYPTGERWAATPACPYQRGL